MNFSWLISLRGSVALAAVLVLVSPLTAQPRGGVGGGGGGGGGGRPGPNPGGFQPGGGGRPGPQPGGFQPGGGVQPGGIPQPGGVRPPGGFQQPGQPGMPFQPGFPTGPVIPGVPQPYMPQQPAPWVVRNPWAPTPGYIANAQAVAVTPVHFPHASIAPEWQQAQTLIRAGNIGAAQQIINQQMQMNNPSLAGLVTAMNAFPANAPANPALQTWRTQALNMAQAQISQGVNEPLPWVVVAKIALENQNQQQFAEASQALVQKFPNNENAHYYNAIRQMQGQNWKDAEQSLRKARELGMPEENIAQLLKLAIDNQKWVWQYAWITLYIIAGWAAGLVLLFTIGKVLSWMTLRSLARRGPEVASFSDRWLRKAYRWIVTLAGCYYYLSLPVVVLLSIAIPLTLGYAVLAVPYVNLWLAGVVLVLGLGGIITALSGIRAAFIRVQAYDTGHAVAPDEWPAIWELAREVAAKVGTRVVDEIRIVPSAQLAVIERGSYWQRLQDRGRRVLVLGVGALYGLKLDALKGILAHEYGHFQHRDTAGGDLALQVYVAMQNFADAIVRRGKIRWWDIAVHFLRAYHFLFRRLTFGASRLQEVLADRLAVQCYGRTAFCEGLKHVIRRSVEFDVTMNKAVREAMQRSEPVLGFYRPESPPELLEREQIEMVVRTIMDQATNADDSHPSPKDRFALAERVAAEDPPLGSATAWDLVAAQDRVLQEMSQLVDQAVDEEARHAQAMHTAIIEYFSKMLRQQPMLEGFFERGRVHLDRGDFTSAVNDFNTVLQKVPQATDARYGRALAFKWLKRYEPAISDFQKVAEEVASERLPPEQVFSLYLNLGDCLARAGRSGEAVAAYDRALQQQPTSLVVLVERGRAHCERLLYDQAIQDFTRAIEQWPTSPEPYLERARAYDAQGAYDLAQRDRDAACQLDGRVRVAAQTPAS